MYNSIINLILKLIVGKKSNMSTKKTKKKVYKEHEILPSEVLPGLRELTQAKYLNPPIGEAWEIRYLGQMIAGYNGSTQFGSPSLAKRSFLLKMEYAAYYIIKEYCDNNPTHAEQIRPNTGSRDYRKEQRTLRKICEDMIDEDLIQFIRVR